MPAYAAPPPRPSLQRRVGEDADDVVRQPVRDVHRRVLHHDVRRRAAAVHARQQPQVRQPEVVLQADAAHPAERRDAGVHQQAVDLVLPQPGVRDRALDRLRREVLRVVPVHAPHLGDAEPGDRRHALEFASVHAVEVIGGRC